MIENFLGTWILDESQNKYETNTAPKKGKYIISQIDGEKLLFEMEWVDANDNFGKHSYISVIDGKKYEYENKEVAEFLQSRFISDLIMESKSFKDGKTISIGTRELSKDKDKMNVSQIAYLQDGTKITNRSVYLKLV